MSVMRSYKVCTTKAILKTSAMIENLAAWVAEEILGVSLLIAWTEALHTVAILVEAAKAS